MQGLPAYQPTQVLEAGHGVNEFVAPITINAAQAAFPQFQIVLGNIIATYVKFPFIRGITVDNTANLTAGTSFIISADGTQQEWVIPPGGWQIIPVSGAVISLTITPTSWASGSVQFTLWNTVPPPQNVLSNFSLSGSVNASITGPVSINALGSVDITNAFIKQQLAQVEGTAFGNATNVAAGTTVIALVPNVFPAKTAMCQTLQIVLSFLTIGAVPTIITYGIRGAGNSGPILTQQVAYQAGTTSNVIELYHESNLAMSTPLAGFGIEGFYTLSAAVTAIEMSYFIGFYQF